MWLYRIIPQHIKDEYCYDLVNFIILSFSITRNLRTSNSLSYSLSSKWAFFYLLHLDSILLPEVVSSGNFQRKSYSKEYKCQTHVNFSCSIFPQVRNVLCFLLVCFSWLTSLDEEPSSRQHPYTVMTISYQKCAGTDNGILKGQKWVEENRHFERVRRSCSWPWLKIASKAFINFLL